MDVAAKGHASPYATGGGGVVLEHGYGAVLLAALLTQGPVRGLGEDVVLAEVRFQQSAWYPVDDLLVVGQGPTGERRMFVGVRRNPTIGVSSPPFVDLLADYLRMVVDHLAEFDAGRWRLGLAVAAPHTGSAELATLAWNARKQRSHAMFRSAVNAPLAVRSKIRERLQGLDAAVAVAAARIGAGIDPEELTWQLLRALRVVHLALEGDDPADRYHAVNELRRLAGGVAQAADLWRRLTDLSAGYAQAAASVDQALLFRDLGTRVGGPAAVARLGPVPLRERTRVSEADPRQLGVHASIRVDGVDSDMPSYVERDVDGGERGVRALVATAAQRGGFVLLVGGSSVGKTRCAYEAVRAVLPDWWLVHPSSSDDIAALAADPPHRTVLWLDEIQRYFGGERGLAGGIMRALLSAPSPIVIVGTIWPDRYLRFTDTPTYDSADPHAQEREVIELAEVVVVADAFTPAERRRAETAAATDRVLATALNTTGFGLTQTLAAAPQLVSHWEIAKTVHPYAWALLLAAVDLNRLGAEHPLPEALLREAAPGYCTERQRAEAPDDWFELGMAYATRKLHGATAALSSVGGTEMGRTVGYVVADYLLQHVIRTRPAEPVPANVWGGVLEHLTDTADMVVVAESAAAHLLYRHAVALYRRAADAGNRSAAAQWAVHTGDPAAIADLRARAGDRGDGSFESKEAAEEATQVLADALVQGGELDQLRELFRPTGFPSGTTWRISQRLARVLADRGAYDELRTLADRGDLAAAERLADFLALRGNADELRERARIEPSVVLPPREDEHLFSGDRKREQTAARDRLADYLAHRGDLAELAARTDEPATRRMFTLLRHRGDIPALRRLAASRGGEIKTELVQMLAHRGDLEELISLAATADEKLLGRIADVFAHRGALDELEILMQYHWPAADRLASILADRGDLARLGRLATRHMFAEGILVEVLIARGDVAALYRLESALSGTPMPPHLTTQELNRLLVDRGAVDELADRADRGDSDAVRKLAHTIADRGDIDAAWRLLRTHGLDRRWRVTSVHDELGADRDDLAARAQAGEAVAAARLAHALIRRGDLDQLRSRADLGDDFAAGALAEAFLHRGEFERLRALADEGHRTAAEKFADVLVYQGRVDALTIRADSGDEQASDRLLDLLVHRGDLDGLRRRADAGDLLAARQWNEMVADRGDIDRLRDQAGHDLIVGMHLADLLLDRGEIAELRARADNHDYGAADRLAKFFADRGEIDRLRARANAGDFSAEATLAHVLADQRAIDELRTRTREHRDDFQATQRLVDVLVAQGDLAEAHRMLLAQVTIGDHRAARRLPELLTWLGRHDEARQLARHGLNTDGSPAASTERRLKLDNTC
ncbi:hypothetical protein GCM10007977_101390 [Dactylosporangium sucinum]|uniref:Uncharacterized protein n=2 Tax=Dactylosporangium sucinum TaxID=1424081 RepID=A0A917UDX5_9ACTN|nr:hypothetical protein GCM10007977_101390 [Dactylosporangium sucinum]